MIILYALLCVVAIILVICILGNIIYRREDIEPTINDRNSIRPNGKYPVNIYKTKDGKKHYIFRYVPQCDSIYEIDIMYQPPYNGRDSDPLRTHRLLSVRGDCNYKICIHDHSAPKTLDAAMEFSAAWAELTHEYIKTGVKIDDQIARRNNGRY